MTQNFKKNRKKTRRIPKVTLLVFRVHGRTLNWNQSKECKCVMEFPLNHFNVLILGFSGYDRLFVLNCDNFFCPKFMDVVVKFQIYLQTEDRL